MLRSLCSIAVFVVCVSMLYGCGVKKEEAADSAGDVKLARISCIGVLPPAATAEEGAAPVYIPEDRGSRHGVQVMTEILSKELGGKSTVRFVGIDQLASLQLTGGENSLDLARMVAEQINCNAMLETSVNRFTERIGGRYSVESPASVAFSMRLISIDDGSILWSAKFDEVQKSVMENILEWEKANSRGFVWITAEELMREGVREKLGDSPYFNSPER